MAEIIDTETMSNNFASNGKANSALTLGIIGTALAVLGAGSGLFSGLLGKSNSSGMSEQELYLERQTYQNNLATTKEYYTGQATVNERLVNAFFDSYQRDVDNSFKLYKNQRDSDDALSAKIEEVNKKVDIMSAIRPYQDALINSKIDNNAIVAAYELQKRTCRMIEGELVLPSTPTVTGYASWTPWTTNNTTSTT